MMQVKSEKKQTAINLIAKILSYGTTMMISFFLTPYLVEKIGKEAYSFYPLANNFVNYMSVITVALNSMGARFITIALTRGEEKKANTYFVSILYGNIIMSLVLFIPLTLIVVFLDVILDIPLDLVSEVKLLFALVFISMVVNLVTNVFGVAVFSKNRLELGSICDIAIALVRVGLYALLFVVFEPTIAYVGVVSLIVAIFTALIQRYYTQKLLPNIKMGHEFFQWQAIVEVISSGIWNSVNQIGVILLSTIGLMVCNRLYGAAAGGDYSIALTIPQFLNGIVSMLSSVFLPGLTIKYASSNRKEIIEHVHNAQHLIALLVNIPVAIFMAIGVNFFKLWTPSVDAEHLQILSILAIGYLLITSAAWPISNLNTVMNKVKIPAIVMVGTGLVNVVLIYIMYMHTDLGIYSIPLGQLVLFILNRGIFIPIYSAHGIRAKWNTFYPAIIKGVLCAGITYVVSAKVNEVINPDNWLLLILEVACLVVVLVPIGALIIFGKKILDVVKNRLK